MASISLYANHKHLARRYDDTDIITVLATTNPKRGISAQRFNCYRSGMTVREAMQAGLTPSDLRWDAMHDFIKISPAPQLTLANVVGIKGGCYEWHQMAKFTKMMWVERLTSIGFSVETLAKFWEVTEGTIKRHR